MSDAYDWYYDHEYKPPKRLKDQSKEELYKELRLLLVCNKAHISAELWEKMNKIFVEIDLKGE